MQPPLFAPLSQTRKDHLHKVIPLGMHIAEGRRDKDPNGLPGCGHQANTPKDDRVNRVSNGLLVYSSSLQLAERIDNEPKHRTTRTEIRSGRAVQHAANLATFTDAWNNRV
jgi:hypothetical protein